MAEVVDLHPKAERRGLAPAAWADVLYGWNGMEVIALGGDQAYRFELFMRGISFEIHFHSEYPDGTYTGLNFSYVVSCETPPDLEEVNEFNRQAFNVSCVLDDKKLYFFWYVHLSNDELTESLLKSQIHQWLLALPGIAAFAHKFGD